jgi:arabinofuranosyltransferase
MPKKKRSQPWYRNPTVQLNIAIGVTFALVVWLLLTHSWFSDDAYFSFRSVDNFVNGYGLTWNVQERVQGYTHPLWVLMLSVFYFFTREIYLTTIVVSLALTLLLVWLVIYKLAATRWHGVLAVWLLCLSTAFVDYWTSGLENPLSHMLMAIFLVIFLRGGGQPRWLLWLSLTAALAAVNRLDTILFYAPAPLYAWFVSKDRWQATRDAVIGFLPLAAWELFSLIYYGFPFPNTYYAKEQTFVPLLQEVWAGLNYYLFTLFFDPITWVVIVAALATAIILREPKARALAIGIGLYLLYILQIGGDFMGGRFLSIAYLASAALLMVYVLPRLTLKKHWLLIPALLLVSLLASSPPYVLYAKGFQTARWNEVVDERMVYHTTNFIRIEDVYAFNSDPTHHVVNDLAFFVRSLLRGTAFRWEGEHDWIELGRELRAEAEAQGGLFLPQGANGFTGYYAGPQVYIAHGLALTDPLLARMPPIHDPNWRSGHFMRVIPPGYVELEAGLVEHLDDPALDAYYQKLRLVTQGPLFSAERWAAIWELNTRDLQDFAPQLITPLRFPRLQLASITGTGAHQLDLTFSGQGSAAQVDFATPSYSATLQLGISADNFELFYLNEDGEIVGSHAVYAHDAEDGVLVSVDVPVGIAQRGYAGIRLVPVRVFYIQADLDYALYSLSFDQ